MKILLLGAGGQLGTILAEKLQVIGNIAAFDRTQLDITNADAVENILARERPDVIVNAAAYTAVDKAENDQHAAFLINHHAVEILAQKAKQRGIWFLHYSTDYVFNGEKTTPYEEHDPTHPLNVYGASKLAGEQAILASQCLCLIFRTTWVIGTQGKNFAKTILDLSTTRDRLKIIEDQKGVPTSPDLIAKVTISALEAIKRNQAWPMGIYHLTPKGKTSWYGIAQHLLMLAQSQKLSLSVQSEDILPIPTLEYPTPAKRPLNSCLNTDKLQKNLDFQLPNWEDDFNITALSLVKEFQKHET